MESISPIIIDIEEEEMREMAVQEIRERNQNNPLAGRVAEQIIDLDEDEDEKTLPIEHEQPQEEEEEQHVQPRQPRTRRLRFTGHEIQRERTIMTRRLAVSILKNHEDKQN